MAEIYVYEAGATDLGSIGLCGCLTPISCEFEDIANGLSAITLKHPFDEWGKFRFLQPDRILSVEVPVRNTPEIEDGDFVTNVETWTVLPTASQSERTIYNSKTGDKKLKVVKINETVTVVKAPVYADRYKVKYKKWSGWMPKTGLQKTSEDEIPDDVGGIELVAPSWKAKPQYFRIDSVDISEGDGVTVHAKHIFYDLYFNLTDYKTANAYTLQDALDGILTQTVSGHDFTAQTNIQGTHVGFSAKDLDPVTAVLDPDAGLCKEWDAELIRDNYDFFLLDHAGFDRGTSIEYAKNLAGVTMTTDMSKLCTSIRPIGEAKDGKPLYLSATNYPDGCINSPLINNYAFRRTMRLIVNEAKVDGEDITVADARRMMRDAVSKQFNDENIDKPIIQTVIDFAALGDGDKYSQYRELDKVYLYDTVTVRHEELGIDITSQVVRIVYDCLRETFIAVEIGSLADLAPSIAGWQLAGGIPGNKLVAGSVGAGQLGDRAIETMVSAVEVGGGNLIRYADSKVSIGVGSVNNFDTDAWYRKGGKEFRMYPFTGISYNYVQFLSAIPIQAGKTYTISFYAWAFGVSGDIPPLYTSLSGTDTDSESIYHVLGSVTLTSAPTLFVHTFTATQTANAEGVRVLFSIPSTFSPDSAWITVTDVKLETGNKATDWSPYREEMRAGANVAINDSEVSFSAPAFSIDIGSDGDKEVKIDETGAIFKSLEAPNVAPAYNGATAISVPGDMSLKTAFENLSNKILTQNVTITLTNDDNSSGAIRLVGVLGYGQITVTGAISGQSATGGRKVKQAMTITSCQARIVFEDISCTYQGGAQVTANADTFLRFTRCLFNSGQGTSIMVVLNNGTNATLYQCQLVNQRTSGGATLVQANFNADLLMHSCKGGTSGNFVSTNGGNVKVYSSRPKGAWARAAASLTAPSDLTTVTQDGTGYDTSPVPAPSGDSTATTYDASYKGDYTGGTWSTNYMRQGIFGGRSYVGCVWFNLSSISSRTIQSGSLTLARNAAGSDSSNVRLKTISLTGRSGNPTTSVINDYGKIGVSRRQKTVEIDIPAAAISDIKANGGGLMLYVNDTEQMSGKQYSANYASYDSATLSVTYV